MCQPRAHQQTRKKESGFSTPYSYQGWKLILNKYLNSSVWMKFVLQRSHPEKLLEIYSKIPLAQNFSLWKLPPELLSHIKKKKLVSFYFQTFTKKGFPSLIIYFPHYLSNLAPKLNLPSEGRNVLPRDSWGLGWGGQYWIRCFWSTLTDKSYKSYMWLLCFNKKFHYFISQCVLIRHPTWSKCLEMLHNTYWSHQV